MALAEPVFGKAMSIEENRIVIINPATKALFISGLHEFMGVLSDKTVLVKVY
jgi:hypothetical protein